jgi:hypothetical protein
MNTSTTVNTLTTVNPLTTVALALVGIVTTYTLALAKTPKDTLLLEQTVIPGYVPTPQPTTGLRIYRSGRVVSFSGKTETLLATMSAVGRRKIQDALRGLPSTEAERSMRDPNPTHPFCEDAPVDTISAFTDGGQALPLKKHEKCHTFAVPHPSAQSLVSLVEGFAGLR